MQRSISALSDRQFMNKTFYPLSSGSTCVKPMYQTHKDEVNSLKLGGILVPSQSGVGCQGRSWNWRGSERAPRRPYVHLTPASLNRWTSREHLPPLLSNHSSVFSSLCRQDEKCIITVFAHAVDCMSLCMIINNANWPRVDSHDFRLARDRLLSRGCVRWLGPWVADLTILSMISSAVSSVQFTASSLAEHHGGTHPKEVRSEWIGKQQTYCILGQV